MSQRLLSDLSEVELRQEYTNTCAQYGEAVDELREMNTKVQNLQVRMAHFKNERNRRVQQKAAEAQQQAFENAKKIAEEREKKLTEEREAILEKSTLKTPTIAEAEARVEKILEQRHAPSAH